MCGGVSGGNDGDAGVSFSLKVCHEHLYITTTQTRTLACAHARANHILTQAQRQKGVDALGDFHLCSE